MLNRTGSSVQCSMMIYLGKMREVGGRLKSNQLYISMRYVYIYTYVYIYIYIYITDSCGCTAETNTIL